MSPEKSGGVRPGTQSGTGRRFAVVVARFNHDVTSRLLAGCLSTLTLSGTAERDIRVCWVPGAMEIGVVARRLALRDHPDAVICLGAVIRGETPHFDFVSASSVEAVSRLALETGVPAIMGILTTDTVEQALDRCGGVHGHKGSEAAETALEMANLLSELEEA